MPDEPRSQQRPAVDISVAMFRQILIWPLALHLPPADGGVNAILKTTTKVIDRLTCDWPTGGSPWQPVDDPGEHIACPSPGKKAAWRAERFAEGVYFHDFVQSFLFSPREPRDPNNPREPLDQVPFRLFRRSDITGVEVALADNAERTMHLRVERVNLYVFRTGAAILVVETAHDRGDNGQAWHLNDIQDFQEQFRRAYIPHADHTLAPSGLVVKSVVWRRRDGGACPYPIDRLAMKAQIDLYLDHTRDDRDKTGLRRRTPPVFEYWEFLLANALPLANSGKRPGDVAATWNHVVDERIPVLTTISVTPGKDDPVQPDPLYYYNATERGDLIRLCFADRADASRPLPYEGKSLKRFEADHVYGAFRDQGSLFMASGFAFVTYGAGGAFFDPIVALIHMRRHYFQLYLLAQLELASLLSFSSRISNVVAAYKSGQDTEEEFEAAMLSIQDEYLLFLHRFRFTGASNHVQAQAITALLRRHLRLREIFDDLHQEITSATGYLFNGAASRGARTVERLQTFGVLALILALTFALFSANMTSYGQWFGGLLLHYAPWLGNLLHTLSASNAGSQAGGPHVLRPLTTMVSALAVFAWVSLLGLILLSGIVKEFARRLCTKGDDPIASISLRTTDKLVIKIVFLIAATTLIAALALIIWWGINSHGAFN